MVEDSTAALDLSSLLSHVHEQQAGAEAEEADLYDAAVATEVHFGHPPQPQLNLLRLCKRLDSDDDNNSSDIMIVVANTKHCVSAQVLQATAESRNESNDPIQLFRLIHSINSSHSVERQQRETISSLRILTLNDLDLQLQLAKDELDIVESEDDEDDENEKSLSKDRRPIAVVLGTSFGRILSIELEVNLLTGAFRRTFPSRYTLSLQDIDIDMGYFEPLPFDEELSKKSNRKINCFAPTGGVSSISVYCVGNKKESTRVWIVYGDGTIVCLHHAAFFSSVMYSRREKCQDILSTLGVHESLVKSRMQLTGVKNGSVIPLPKYHPTPLASMAPLKLLNEDDTAPFPEPFPDDEGEEDEEKPPTECQEAIFYPNSDRLIHGFPALTFFTSEDQYVGTPLMGGDSNQISGEEVGVIGTVIGSTAAIVTGVVGSAFGAIFGYGGAQPRKEIDKDQINKREDNFVKNTKDKKDNISKVKHFFPTVQREPIRLFAGFEMHDSPRQIDSCTVDPNGDLAATTDLLGRVLLFDLSTKRIVRMWKGFREATCCWLQIDRARGDKSSRKLLFLVIHSRKRRVVEVWHVRHGPCVKSIQVGRDAHLVPCKEWSGSVNICTCYLSKSNIPGAPFNHLERIVIDEGEIKPTGVPPSTTPGAVRKTGGYARSMSLKETALKLQRVKQLLANTNVPCKAKDIENALFNITSLKDLATTLDRLAVASVLELKMEIRGAGFQKVALKYCRKKLGEAVKESKDKDPSNNPNVMHLANKILYHSQLVNAFDILHKFEIGISDSEYQKVSSKSHWIVEAVGWISTCEKVASKNLDTDSRTTIEPIRFASFANAANAVEARPLPVKIYKNQKRHRLQIYFSDSSKTRRDILVHIFMPLLGDIFAFNVVNSVFDALGIKEDCEYLLKCFGEWFMTLSAKEASQKGFFIFQSPMMRWLQELAMMQFERHEFDEHEIILKTLHSFCEKSPDLVRSFLLGVLCREAVASASQQLEEKTYGKVSSATSVRSWDRLLRKLRVCLLVSLRLHCFRIGTFSITVNNVDQIDFFSVYEWLAHDELAMSQKQEEILSLENACNISGFVFDPSLEAGDDDTRFRTLQNSCVLASINEERQAEFSGEDYDKLGALHLYLNHYNEPRILVAHRALILASKWSSNPSDIETLGDAVVSLESLWNTEGFESLAYAVRLEVWQTQIRPIFRAYIFGFNDVQEISESVIAPLFGNPGWMRKFYGISLDILSLLMQTEWNESMNLFDPPLQIDCSDEIWPPVRTDFILKRLVERSREIIRAALDMHRIIVCALVVSKEIQNVYNCVPCVHDCFDPVALFNPMPRLEKGCETQLSFIEDAITARAQAYSGPPLETLHLEEIDVLVKMWGLDLKTVRTIFFLCMYEYGKDRAVDKLLTKSTSCIDVHRFVQDGVDIVCRRLNDIIHLKRSQPQELRDAIGLLDADMCEWIRERSVQSIPLVPVVYSNLQVPIANTHLLALRLLGLSRGANDDPAKRVKIHSLIVLSGTLVKAMENN